MTAEGFPTGSCRYETLIGSEIHRCAVGCLLSPAGLSEKVKTEHGWVELREFGGLVANVYEAGFKLDELAGVEDEFLSEAQYLHDNVECWETGSFDVASLDELAGEFGLTVVKDEVGAPRPEVVVIA